MARILGLDMAPVKIPIERRLQTFMVWFYCFMFFAPLFMGFSFIALLFSQYFWLALGYGAWIVYDVTVNRISSHGGRRWEWLRHNVMWHYLRDYFPCKLIKTADLDPSKNYLFGSHPHGILGCGSFANFATEANGFSELYPGIKPHLLTLTANFIWPLLRGILLWMGVCDVSKDSIQWILTKQGTGNVAIVVVGGAEEALNAHPGKYDLTMKKRKGFIKIAIRTGACLVPVFTFGENDLFAQLDNPEGSRTRNIQTKLKSFFGVSPPLYYGRGVFNYNFGFIPHRKPVTTVVGTPIETERCSDPSPEQIDKVHQRYMEELAQLFDQHKTQFGVPKDKSLNFI